MIRGNAYIAPSAGLHVTPGSLFSAEINHSALLFKDARIASCSALSFLVKEKKPEKHERYNDT